MQLERRIALALLLAFLALSFLARTADTFRASEPPSPAPQETAR